MRHLLGGQHCLPSHMSALHEHDAAAPLPTWQVEGDGELLVGGGVGVVDRLELVRAEDVFL